MWLPPLCLETPLSGRSRPILKLGHAYPSRRSLPGSLLGLFLTDSRLMCTWFSPPGHGGGGIQAQRIRAPGVGARCASAGFPSRRVVLGGLEVCNPPPSPATGRRGWAWRAATSHETFCPMYAGRRSPFVTLSFCVSLLICSRNPQTCTEGLIQLRAFLETAGETRALQRLSVGSVHSPGCCLLTQVCRWCNLGSNGWKALARLFVPIDGRRLVSLRHLNVGSVACGRHPPLSKGVFWNGRLAQR